MPTRHKTVTPPTFNPKTFLKALSEEQRSYSGILEVQRKVCDMAWQEPQSWSTYNMDVLHMLFPSSSEDKLMNGFGGYRSHESGRKLGAKLLEKVQAVVDTYPEAIEKKKRQEWYKGWIEEYTEYRGCKKSLALFKKVVETYKLLETLTSNELAWFNGVEITREHGNEFISISVRASVWTYYVDGYMEINGTRYEVVDASYGGDINRL